MATVSEHGRLLALGLLNFADDSGYFWANPLMIRGALFPFDDDSTKVRRSIAQLVKIGFLRLGKTADGRECGCIVKFAEHQRIDRPKPSDIKPVILFDEDSTNDRRSIDDRSLLDRKGREGKGRDRSSGAGAPAERTPSLKVWLAKSSELHPEWPADDSQNAWEYYERVGWKSGKNPIVKWEMCIATCFRNWKRNVRPATIPGANRHQMPAPTAADYEAAGPNGGWGPNADEIEPAQEEHA